MKNTFDRTVYSLCLEIDELKEGVKYWREKCEEERNANNYFGANRLGDNYVKGFKYKDVSEYSNITEWLKNVFISMNENHSIKSCNGNIFYIIDKRMGINYSLMGGFMTTEKQNELMNSEGNCIIFLTDYYYAKNVKTKF